MSGQGVARAQGRGALPPLAGLEATPAELDRFLRANGADARARVHAEFAATLGLERGPKETADAFAERVSEAARRAGKAEPLRAALQAEQERLREDGVYLFLAHRCIAGELARRGVGSERARGETLEPALAALIAAMASGAGLAPDSAEAVALAKAWTAEAITKALRDPHAQVFERTLPELPPEARSALLDTLEELYAPVHGAGAAAAVAADLSRDGPAAEVARLAASTGRLSFTAADFDAPDDRKLEPALPAVAPELADPLERALTPVALEVSGGRLAAHAEPSPFLDALRAGRLRVGREESSTPGLPPKLVLVAPDGKPHPDTAEAQALLAELEHAAAGVARHVDLARPESLEALAREAGLGLWIDRLGTDWLTSSEAVRGRVEGLAVRAGLQEKGQAQDLGAKLGALGLPDAARRAALEVEQRTRMLQTLRPLPPEFLEVLEGTRSLTLPLTVGAPLDPVQSRTVAALQTHLSSIGSLEAPSRPGELDAATVTLLRDLANDPGAASVEFDAARATRALAGLAAFSAPRQTLVAEAILAHPGVRAVLRAAPELHAVDAALAYLRTEGEEGMRPSMLDAGRLAEALERTAQRPPSPETVERAVRDARAAPVSQEARTRLLAGRASSISSGATRVFQSAPALDERETVALARRLAVHALPQRTLSIPRGEWSASLVDKAPVVALRLAATSLAATIDPSTLSAEVREALAAVRSSVGASAEVSGVLDAQLLTVLGASILASGSPGTAERGKTWARVIAAVAEGRVALADLEPLPEKGPLERDVNAVLAELRGLLPTLRDHFLYADSATAAEELQRAPLRPLASDSDPGRQLSRARAVIAAAAGGPPPAEDGPLTREDFDRLTAFVRKLAEETPKEGGTERNFSARRFLEDWRVAEPVLAEVTAAVGRGELSVEGARVRAKGRDARLEAQGEAAARLFLRAADLRLDHDRHQNEGLVGDAKRLAAAAPHLVQLPELAEPSTPALDRATPLLLLKAEQRSAQGGPPLGLPRWLRDARDELNAQSLEALIAQMTPQGPSASTEATPAPPTAGVRHTLAENERASLQTLLELLRAGQVEPFRPLERKVQTALEGEVDHFETARNVLQRALDAEAKALQGVDRSTIEFLLAKHPDAVGQGFLTAALMGAPERSGAASQAALLQRLAAQMGDGPGWDTVNPLPSDDPDTAAGKRALRVALEQLAGAGGGAPLGLPVRELSAAKALVQDSVGLTPSRTAMDLRGALILAGLVDSSAAGELNDGRLSPRVLAQSARLATSLAQATRDEQPRLAERLDEAATRLAAASARGPHTLGLEASTDAVDRAVRLVVEAAVAATPGPRAMAPLDLLGELPPVEALTVTGPIGNRVLDAPPEGGLDGVAARAGTRATPEDVARAEREARSRTARFDPTHFALTTGAKLTQYWALMPTLVAYELSAKPESRLAQAAASAAAADAPEELDAASDTVGETVKDVTTLGLGLASFKTGTGFVDEVVQLWDDGRHDEAAAAAVATAVMARGIVGGAVGTTRRVTAWARRNEVMAVEGSPTRTLAVPVETKPAAEAPGLGRRAAASAVDLTARGLSTLRHPVEPLVKAPVRALRGGVRAALGAVGLPTGIRFDGVEPSFEYRLTAAERLELAKNPDTRFTFRLRTARGVEALQLSGHQLRRLGQLESPRIDPSFARELGIDGAKLKRHARGLFEMTRGLPPPSAEPSLVTPFKDLVDPKHIRDVQRWSTPSVPDADGGLQLKNATLLKLLAAERTRRPEALRKAILEHGRELGLEDALRRSPERVEAQVRTILENYRHVADKEVASAARRAGILDARAPAPAASTSRSVAVSAPGPAGGGSTPAAGGTPGASGPATPGAPGGPLTPAAGGTPGASGSPTAGGGTAPSAAGAPPDAGQASSARGLAPPPAPFTGGAAPDPTVAAVERFVADAARRYGTRSPSDARALAAIEWTHQSFRSAIAEAAPGSLEAGLIRARFEKWRATVGAFLDDLDGQHPRSPEPNPSTVPGRDLVPTPRAGSPESGPSGPPRTGPVVAGAAEPEPRLSTPAGRARLHALRAEIWQTELSQRPVGERLVAGATDVAKGTGSLLASALKGPAVWGALAMGLPHTLRELGDIYGNPYDPSTPLEKHGRAAAAVATPVVTATAAGVGLNLATRLVPEAARLGPAMLRGGVAALVTQGPDLVERALSAYQGELNAAQAVQALTAIGLPEASFYKVDPERYPSSLVGYDVTNDRGLLESDAGGVPSPRHDYVAGRPATPKPWWRSGEADPKPPAPTTLLQRIVQLLPPERRPAPGAPLSTALLRRPQDLRLDQVRSYEEPRFPTWEFLRRLDALGERTPALRSATAAQGFDFSQWQAGVRARTAELITQAETPDGRLSFSLRPEALEGLDRLFAENDFAGALTPAQRTVVERRRRDSVEAVGRWLEVLNALGIGADEKRAALGQFLENMVANHRANAIMFEVLGREPKLDAGRWTHVLSRDANADDYYVGVMSFL